MKARPPLKAGWGSRWVSLFRNFAMLVCLWGAQTTWADGVRVWFQATNESRIVSLVGPMDINARIPVTLGVLVQQAPGGQPILDAQIRLRVRPPKGAVAEGVEVFCGVGPAALAQTWNDRSPNSLTPPLRRDDRANPLLYATQLAFPIEGPWEVAVSVGDVTAEAIFRGDVVVGAPIPRWRELLWQLTVPPLGILLFVANQLLRRNRGPASSMSV